MDDGAQVPSIQKEKIEIFLKTKLYSNRNVFLSHYREFQFL